MKFFQKIIIISSLFFLGHSTLQAQGFTPESGFWWNPDEPGHGYSIEIQDNFMFVAFYVYDEFGNPIWYSAGTRMTGQGGNSFFDTDLDLSINGTCIDCNFTQPTTLIGERGPVTIDFTTETTATIQFQGVIKNIERFNFALGDEVDSMLGEWQTVIDLSTTGIAFPFNGDVLIFDITNIFEGNKIAEGCRPDNTLAGVCSDFALQNHASAAQYVSQDNELIIVVDDSPDFFLAYYLQLGLDQFDGVAEIYPKSTGNNNVFYPVRGFRTASRTYVQTGQGPSSLPTDKSDNKSVFGISSLLKDVDIPKKAVKTFNPSEQTKILRRQTITRTMINRLNSTKK